MEDSERRDLDEDLSQNLYYSAAEGKFTDTIIRAQLKQWLFERFPIKDPTRKNLRDSVITKVLNTLNALQKQLPKEEPMPKEWTDFNNAKIKLLITAIIKVSAETVISEDDNSKFKLGMLKSFLSIDSTS